MNGALESFASARAALIARGGAFASVERSAAWNHFVVTGLPPARGEAWKYTPPGALFGRSFQPAPALEHQEQELPPLLPDSARLVFVNGRVDPLLCSGQGWFEIVSALRAGVDDARVERGELESLNRALFEEAAAIAIEEGQDAGLLEIVHLMTRVPDGAMAHPRVRLRLARNARLALVETFIGRCEQTVYLVNAITEAHLAEGAALRHYAVQAEAPRGLHVSSLSVHQASRSRFSSYSVQLGASVARREVRVQLAGEGAEAEVDGLSVGRGQHHDLDVRIDHQEPSCGSRQRFRAVLDDRARGVFSGKVRIQPDAQQTRASQHARALLLSEGCEADLRPHLEIHADDVQATHGATVGELDPEQVFYLRSRGVPESEARALLTSAFARELVEAIAPVALRERVEALVCAKLNGGA